jgi:hypothetical protein
MQANLGPHDFRLIAPRSDARLATDRRASAVAVIRQLRARPADSGPDHFLEAAQQELNKFERQESEFRKKERQERAAELQIPLDKLALLITHCRAVEALASELIENRRVDGERVERIIMATCALWVARYPGCYPDRGCAPQSPPLLGFRSIQPRWTIQAAWSRPRPLWSR